ncbi:MAG: hypothetical protein Q8O92_11255 [Candidatus Latescibacter sp.]|nr:hypothetical protein [Candidatus Latescibacter sp.]
MIPLTVKLSGAVSLLPLDSLAIQPSVNIQLDFDRLAYPEHIFF